MITSDCGLTLGNKITNGLVCIKGLMKAGIGREDGVSLSMIELKRLVEIDCDSSLFLHKASCHSLTVRRTKHQVIYVCMGGDICLIFRSHYALGDCQYANITTCTILDTVQTHKSCHSK